MHFKDKEELENWADKYEKAVTDGVFGEPGDDDTPTPKTSEESFFGAQNCHPTDDINDGDAKYWQGINARVDDPNYRLNKDGLIQEQNKGDAARLAGIVKQVNAAPNPIRYHTAGADQELTPQSQGVTFTPEDISNLSEMKIKLHGLQDQLNSFEGRGKNGKKFESQIASLKKQIDELSNAMTQSFGALPGSSD